jgi:hypothetical protein
MKVYTNEKTINVNGHEVTAYRVDIMIQNGNPRWVVHFLNLLTDKECETAHAEAHARSTFTLGTELMFEKALKKARTVGGVKYRAKWFGGGIVFQSYNIAEDIKQVLAA